MQTLKLVPVIHYFDTVKEWIEAFPIVDSDLFVTNKWLYEQYLKPLGGNPQVIFQEEYGEGEPTDEMIDAMHKDLKRTEYGRIAAFGGGTILDICKVLSLNIPDRSEDLFTGKAEPKKMKQLVAVPTTCGTGSEVTNVAISSLKGLGIKKGIAVEETFAERVVLIPEPLRGLPYKAFMMSSLDALIHAVESFLSPKASFFTDMFAKKAIWTIMHGYKGMLEFGEEARFGYMKEFLMAATSAGIAFGNAGCGAVHALSYSIGGAFHVPHGEANYQFFAAVMKLYAKKAPNGKIRELTKMLSEMLNLDATYSGPVYDEFDTFLDRLIAKKPLREYGMTEAQIDEFAESTVANQQRLLVNNYVFLEDGEYRAIFADLY
ncbi:MAG: 4-hydroxybutyrate dehydrogenase [Clostridiales bacterium]|nr:4-hydroxybutyrate dehydrogenase [Clostridiales bacterium]